MFYRLRDPASRLWGSRNLESKRFWQLLHAVCYISLFFARQHPHSSQQSACEMDGSGPFYPPWKDEDVATAAAAAAASAAPVSNESRSQSRGSAYSNDSSSGIIFQSIYSEGHILF